jgi:hypothetical protein
MKGGENGIFDTLIRLDILTHFNTLIFQALGLADKTL